MRNEKVTNSFSFLGIYKYLPYLNLGYLAMTITVTIFSRKPKIKNANIIIPDTKTVTSENGLLYGLKSKIQNQG